MKPKKQYRTPEQKQGRSSRVKGAIGERELIKEIQAHAAEQGYPEPELWRTPNSGGLHIKGDINGFRHFHVEVKRHESLRIPEWIRQTEEDCHPSQIPILAFRQSRQPWRVVVRLEDFVGLMLEAEQEPGHLLKNLIKKIEGE